MVVYKNLFSYGNVSKVFCRTMVILFLGGNELPFLQFYGFNTCYHLPGVSLVRKTPFLTKTHTPPLFTFCLDR